MSRWRGIRTVDLVNLLEREKYDGKTGRIKQGLLRTDLVILVELGYLPFSQSGGALLFRAWFANNKAQRSWALYCISMPPIRRMVAAPFSKPHEAE